MQSDVCLESPTNFDHKQLLCDLKKAVDFWFLNRRDSSNDWSGDDESFLQLLLAIKNILLDGLHCDSPAEVLLVCAELIKQLNWLQPTIYCDNDHRCLPTLQPKDSLLFWIYSNFHNSTLCARLQLLVADLELLTSFYDDGAFLSNDRYATALFICLSAVELNQSSLTSQIDASLYASHVTAVPKHKRSSSHPHFSISPWKTPDSSLLAEDHDSIDLNSLTSSFSSRQTGLALGLRKWRSLPNIQAPPVSIRVRSKTISQPNSITQNSSSLSNLYCDENPNALAQLQPSLESSSAKVVQPSASLAINLVECNDIEIYFDQGESQVHVSTPDERPEMIEYDSPPKSLGPLNLLSCFSSSLFQSGDHQSKDSAASASSSPSNHDFLSGFLPQEGKKLKRSSFSIFEDLPEGQRCHFDPNGTNSQSLMLYLQSIQFSHNNTDLERENAHFSVSEALIGVIEKIKCTKKSLKKLDQRSIASGSKLKDHNDKRVEKRRSCDNLLLQKTREHRGRGGVGMSTPSLSELDDSLEESDRLTDGSTEDNIYGSSSSSNNVERNNCSPNVLSAEKVALSLMSKFDGYQKELTSDLIWIVSERDAPQNLLPLPASQSADSDENQAHSFLRGTRDWAPPRQQIIFTDHPYPNRTQLLERQNYRCTGCGMRVSRAYVSRFRYCTYLGKFHCTGCHRNQLSIIPAKVLARWDFNYYPVSVFAYRLLEQIWTYPLFSIPDLNAPLYLKIKNLRISRLKRLQLKYIQDFIMTCRFATEEKSLFNKVATYVTMEPDLWSMFDLTSVKDCSYVNSVCGLISKCEQHVISCELCNARGFFCELCPRKQIIFPWQSRVKRCDSCGTCFHQKCWESITECVKCQRLKIRK